MPLLKNHFPVIAYKIFLIIFFSFPSKNYSQNKYDFDFDSQWKWEDLIDKVVVINPELIKSVNYLRDKISIEDARIILKQLSQLDSLKQLSGVSFILKLDQGESSPGWDSAFKISLDTSFISEDFPGILAAVIKLTDIRISRESSMFEFKNRTYLPQPEKESKENIEINFDYSGAETILNYFNGDTNSLNDLSESNPYTTVFSDKGADAIAKDELVRFLSLSMKEDSLFPVYKWVNPESFWNMGGVSIYKNNIENVIRTINQNEINIKSDIEKLISKYLPDSVFFSVDVMFTLGKKSPGWLSEKNKLAVDLEYFGDDYNYLVRFITHNIYRFAQKEIQLPVDELVVENHDRDFIRVLMNVLENGTANYVGPVGTETRPWYLLEKDFQLFNKTFRNIYKKNNKAKADSLITAGYSGDAPFYTMATQMSYIIETTLGRNALIESVMCGPIFFFSKYIEAYRENPDKIHKVFTFSKKLEKKISDMKVLFPDDVVKSALNLKKYKSDTAFLNVQVIKFLDTYGNSENKNLANLLCARLFLEAGEFSKSKEFFLKGISGRSEGKGELAGEIGDSFFRNNAEDEALYFYNLYVNEDPQNASALQKRGEYYFKSGQNEKARNDFENAMIIDPENKIVKAYLKRINSKL